MHITHHQIEIDTTPEQVMDLCLDVERWPQIFPPCLAARICERTANTQLIELTAQANGRPMTWRSQREIHPDVPMILFRQVQPSVLLSSMEGAWRFLSLSEGRTLVTLEHRFMIKPDVAGLIEGIATHEEAAAYMVRCTHDNSRRELSVMKQVLEHAAQESQASEARARFAKELTIAAPPEAVYELLARAEGWPALLPHCGAIEVLYDDGRNQEFIMTVHVGNRLERIRSIRRLMPRRHVSYFQPAPPPVLKAHTGAWIVEPTEGGTRVTSQHEIVLRPEGVRELWGDITAQDALQRVTNAISDNSLGTMQAIRSRLETPQ
ncbi:MAG: aromatase/cyclase [Polyangia bacterium]